MDNPIPTFTYFVQQIAEKHPNLAFIHVVEPRVSGSDDRVPTAGEVCSRNSSPFPNAEACVP